jgi:ornithine cyclodeaminase
VSIRVINATEVRQLLSMSDCIEVMAVAMTAASDGTVSVPHRIVMPLVGERGSMFVMPGSAPRVDGAKLISQHPANPARKLPAIQGFVALFDHESGSPTAIIDGAEVTAIRTAAASGLATRHLARADASTHGVLGTGVQAAAHIEAVAAVAKIDEVLIWGRNKKKAERLASEQADATGLGIRSCSDPAEAASCDIVSAVTGSPEPVIECAWVRPGAHINLVGAHTPGTREADSDLVTKASVFVDLVESALNESGDILIPMNEGRFDRDHVRGEVGQVISGDADGRRSTDEITIYVSLGITAQDLYAAHAIYHAALENRVGTEVSLSDARGAR